jgi:hypothetical protein
LATVRHFSCLNGKAAKRAGKSEDLAERKVLRNLRGPKVPCPDLEDKNGTSPDRLKSVRGFFFPGPKLKPG